MSRLPVPSPELLRRGLPLAGALLIGAVLGGLAVGATSSDNRSTLSAPASTGPPPAPVVAKRSTSPVPTVMASPSDQADRDEEGTDVTDDDDDSGKQDSPDGALPRAGGPAATAQPAGDPVTCPTVTVQVRDAAGLTSALAAAAPGDVIGLADGTYEGEFVAAVSGTPDAPVWLCGGRGAVLDGGGTTKGYALHLNPGEHWRLVGFTVRNAQKGVMADGTTGSVVQGLLVEQIGDEAIHLRSASTGNLVIDNTIRRTGLRRDKFGEGVYVGSAKSNWDPYGGGGPDRSDYNLVIGNDIAETGSESVDIKEGTTGGAVIGNTFDGTGMTGADSWVDVKGNDWVIEGNTGRGAVKDGFQTHRILDDWGTRNVFRGNTAVDRGSGVDFYLHDPRDTDNRWMCDNRTGSGEPPTSNVPCSR